MGFGVDADGPHRVVAADRRTAIALAVSEAADDAVRPARLTLLPLEIGAGGRPNSSSANRAQYRTVMNSLRRLAPIGRSAVPRPEAALNPVGRVHLGGGHVVWQHVGEQCRDDHLARVACRFLMRS